MGDASVPATDPFPQEVLIRATSRGHGCNLMALYAADPTPRRELSHADYRSEDHSGSDSGDPSGKHQRRDDRPHRVEVSWRAPVAVDEIRLRWTGGYVPTAYRAYVRRGDSLEPLTTGYVAAAEPDVRLAVAGAPVEGVVVEQAADGGSPGHPGVMRIAALCVRPRALPAVVLEVLREGHIVAPVAPLAGDNNPATCLDVSDAQGLVLRPAAPMAVAAIDLVLRRIGSVGAPESVATWLGGVGLEVALPGETSGQRFPLRQVVVDGRGAGVVAGLVGVRIELEAPTPVTSALLVHWPRWPQAVLGLTKVALVPPAELAAPGPVPEEGVIPVTPRGPAISTAKTDEAQLVPSAAHDLAGEAFRRGGEFSFAAARAWTRPVRHAASLGVPGRDERVGVAPDGALQLPVPAGAPHAGSHAAAVHIGVALGDPPRRLGDATPATRRWVEDRLELESAYRHQDLELVQRSWVAPSDGSDSADVWVELAIRNTTTTEMKSTLWLALAVFDFLHALPVRWSTELVEDRTLVSWPGSRRLLELSGEWSSVQESGPSELRLSRSVILPPGARQVLQLRAPLAGTATTSPLDPAACEAARRRLEQCTASVLAGVVSFQLPQEWDSLFRDLMRQTALFVGAGSRVPYGLFPSVYAGDVFGLEEDWAFFGLAGWGAVDTALTAFRRTYLQTEHLSKRHYLHDLRNGLTPWQLQRLLSLAGRPVGELLDARERALLRGLGEWVVGQRAETAAANSRPPPPGPSAPDTAAPGGDDLEADAAPAQRWRTFSGLLPAHRFGGDLGFPTQSLFTDAINCRGLEALATLLQSDDPAASESLFAEARAYRRAIATALDGMRVPGIRPELDVYLLHTGGGDPGSYYQLMAAGILDPIDYFPADDPRPVAIDSYLERSGRLFFGLPRFDDWGSDGFGIDGHYAVGFLLNALRRGNTALFWTGLFGLVAHGMDPEVQTFREVGPVQLASSPEPLPVSHLPGRRLGRSEPCVGSLGVFLQLVRHALVLELPEADGRLGRRLRLLSGVPPSWWDAPSWHVTGMPSYGGLVSLQIDRSGPRRIEVEIDAPEAEELELMPPSPADMWLAGYEIDSVVGDESTARSESAIQSGPLCLPAGRHRVSFVYEDDETRGGT